VDVALVTENIRYGFENGNKAKPSWAEVEHSGIEKQLVALIECICTSSEVKE
jgi:hypothetical protein